MNLKSVSLKYPVFCLLMLIALSVSAQKKAEPADSLRKLLPAVREDTNKVKLLIKLGRAYPKQTDSAVFYLQGAHRLAENLKWQKGMIRSHYFLGDHYYGKADFVTAYTYLNKAYMQSLQGTNGELSVQTASYAAAALYYQKKEAAAVNYLMAAAERFEKKGQKHLAAETYIEVGTYNQYRFNYNAAITYYNKALKLEETVKGQYLRSVEVYQLAELYIHLHDIKSARAILLKAEAAYKKANNQAELADNYAGLAECAEAEHDYDGAIAYYQKTIQIAEKLKNDGLLGKAEMGLSSEYIFKRDYDKAYVHIKQSMVYAKADSNMLVGGLSNLGTIYREAPDSVLVKAGIRPGQRYQKSAALLTQVLSYAKYRNDIQFTGDNLKELSLTYVKMNRYADAFKAYKTYITLRDSTDSLKNEKSILLKEAQLNYVKKTDSLRYQQDITNTQLKQKKLQSYFFIGGIAALLILSVFIALNYINQRKSNRLLAAANDQVTNANHELNEQREKITAQRDQLVDTVANLRTTQQQLVQAEKMASLGELTAGIAHEIQNPLNFVNNFSEVNREMVAELKEALQAGDIAEALAIAGDIEQNEEKINHHGKRADNIVRGMLEHSRATSGHKEPADLNKLTDEYLRLAYHGLRAKNKTFNADLVTHFEPNLPAVNIVSQDVGRVLLNLFNNAFYAVQQRQATTGPDYKPVVEITTSSSISDPANKVAVITVKDNGTGIPDDVKEKIMQPFFTTKPTGQGTGLGLSLSYDIVVKGHGGSISVKSTPGSGAEFIIQLPLV